MSPIFLIAALTLPFSAALFVLKTVYWVYLWQLKEYRVDRMRDFARSTSGQKKLWKNTFTILDVLSVVLLIWVVFNDSWVNVVLSLWVIVTGIQIAGYIRIRSQFKPVMTHKAVLLCGVSVLCAFFFLFAVPVSPYIVHMLMPVLAPFCLSIFVLLLSPVSFFGKRRIIAQAKKKLESMPKKPVVIGITGSYGKSTTKEFLTTLLSQQFTVLATPKHVNVDIGVARMILSSLTKDVEICIIEMAAYTPGEIQSTCDLIPPDIGIVTAISDQHLSLFGSLKNIQHAKGELIRSLPQSGLLVVNSDSTAAVEAGSMWSKAPIVTYSVETTASVYATDIVVTPERVSAKYHSTRGEQDIVVPLHGKHLLSNVIAAIAVSEHLGVTQENMQKGLAHLDTLEGTMRLSTAPTGAQIIDDHYNSNPEGFVAALEYMNVHSGKRKIVVTPGMIELGEHTSERHRSVGKRIGALADVCVITKTDSADDIIAGIHEENRSVEVHVLPQPEEVVSFLQKTTTRDCLLIEGRVHSRIISWAFSS